MNTTEKSLFKPICDIIFTTWAKLYWLNKHTKSLLTWSFIDHTSDLAISAKKSRFKSIETKTKSKNLQVQIRNFSIIVRKTKNNKEIHPSTWPWKELWLFMKVKWNFRLLDNFFLYKNLTFPPLYNFLFFDIPSQPPLTKESLNKGINKGIPFWHHSSFYSFLFPHMAYFDRVLFPLNKGGKGWMVGGCDLRNQKKWRLNIIYISSVSWLI